MMDASEGIEEQCSHFDALTRGSSQARSSRTAKRPHSHDDQASGTSHVGRLKLLCILIMEDGRKDKGMDLLKRQS